MDTRPAATLALIRDSDNGLQVLLLQRTWKAAFLPGYLVFPGGAVDDADHACHEHMADPGDHAISQIMSLSGGGTVYMIAALRECFEEAGLLLAVDDNNKPIHPEHPIHQSRQALFRGEVTLQALCQQHNLTLPLDRLAYLSHWVTPPGAPRRFDTRFFVAVTPQGQSASHDGEETIDHLWISPQQGLADYRSGKRLFSLPTLRTLRVLHDFADTGAAMRYAHANPPEPFPTRPWPARRGDKPIILEPDAPAYAEARKLDPEGAGTTHAEIAPGNAVEIAAGVIRLTSPNPGAMTGAGTNTYLLGHERFTVIDPGPQDASHIERILQLTAGRIDQVLVTHTHQDHSPAANLLKQHTGCRLVGRTTQAGPAGASQDSSFKPNHQPEHGELIASGAGILKVLHTPGHASNHLCYLLLEQETLFSGDHIMQGSTVVINPPDGDMKAYLESLYDLLAEPLRFIAPGHGFVMAQPEATVDYLITHRLAREHKIAQVLKKLAPVSLEKLTASAYDDLPTAIHKPAARSALAHLLKLEQENRASSHGDTWHATRYT